MAEKTAATVSLVFKKDLATRTIAWPCKIMVPLDNGEKQEQSITTRFRIVSPERFKEIMQGALASLTSRGGADVEMFDACVGGFDGLKDENGDPVADADAIDLFRGLPYAVLGILNGYQDMVSGRVSKNS